MRKATSFNQLPEPIKSEAKAVRKSHERALHSPKKIASWMGLARGEREVLHAIRKRMKAQTTLAGSKGWCSATDEQIASDSKYSVKQTRRIIAGLREKNILEIKGGTIKVKGKDRPRTFPGSRRGFAIHEQSACFREEERKKTSQ